MWIAVLQGCSKNEENGAGDVDAAESLVNDSAESPFPDVMEEGDAQDTPQDPTEESDQPWGVVSPRCGDSLVGSCADCPGRPYVCHPCEMSANCVADCGAGCGGDVNCPGTGECVDPGVQCTAEIFCGCEPPKKSCRQEGSITCVDSCTTCPGQTYNDFAECRDGGYPGSCPDGEGPEYLCEAEEGWSCAQSCEACGPHFCVVGSCANAFCENGYIPDYAYYTCGMQFCCEEGYLCPAASACVPDCSECPGATLGGCSERGKCVADCNDCPFADQDAEMQLCSGECVDIHSDLDNCGACGQVCTLYNCVDGHCCELGGGPPAKSWCDVCNCCFKDDPTYCVPSYCEHGCVN